MTTIFSSLRLGKNRKDFVQMLVGRKKNDAAAGVIQREGSLVCGERGIERDGHGAQQQAGEIGHRPLGAIFAENGDAVAADECPRHGARGRFWRRFGQIRAK